MEPGLETRTGKETLVEKLVTSKVSSEFSTDTGFFAPTNVPW